LAAKLLSTTTAGINPEHFPNQLLFSRNPAAMAVILAVLLAAGLALRVHDLGAESLGEDEFNKLETVAEYRQNGISSKNGEHPFLMKGLQAVSIIASEKLNSSMSANISEEAALRFPVALFGTFSALLLFFFVSELFGSGIGLVSAALWTVEPLAIGFDRVARRRRRRARRGFAGCGPRLPHSVRCSPRNTTSTCSPSRSHITMPFSDCPIANGRSASRGGSSF